MNVERVQNVPFSNSNNNLLCIILLCSGHYLRLIFLPEGHGARPVVLNPGTWDPPLCMFCMPLLFNTLDSDHLHELNWVSPGPGLRTTVQGHCQVGQTGNVVPGPVMSGALLYVFTLMTIWELWPLCVILSQTTWIQLMILHEYLWVFISMRHAVKIWWFHFKHDKIYSHRNTPYKRYYFITKKFKKMNIIWFDVNVFIYLFILFSTRSSKSELKTKKISHFKKVFNYYLFIYLFKFENPLFLYFENAKSGTSKFKCCSNVENSREI